MPELETVDLEGVEILAAGGPVKALGSPPEGDYYTPGDLKEMVEAAHELAAEVKAPARIGHRRFGESMEQALRSSPAVGWLSNHRLSDDGTKYLVDVKRAPKKFAELIRAGAYRTRSAEISRITSQRTGKTYDSVITGLAWLGDKLPAIQTLDDVVALYEGDGERRTVVLYEDGAPTEELLAALVRAVTDALARDIAEDEPGSHEPPADTRPVPTFTEEQRKSFADATGLAVDKVTDEMLGKAGIEAPADPAISEDDAKKLAETLGVEGDEITAEKLLEAAKRLNEGGGDGDDDGDDDGDEKLDELTRRLEAAERTAKNTDETLRKERRDGFVEAAMKEGKIAPGQRETLERLYDASADDARKFVSEAPINDELVRIYGSEDVPEDEQEALDKAYAADAATRFGIPVEQVV